MKNTLLKIIVFLTFLLHFVCINSDTILNVESSLGARYDIYFNDPGTTQYNGVTPIADDKIVDLINAAKKTVHFSFYGFSKQNIIDAVLHAIERGLDVKFAGDYTHFLSRQNGYMSILDYTRKFSNVQMVAGNSLHIMHNKFLIVDGLYIMTGTGNITSSGFNQNNNSWSIIESESLAKDFKNELDQMMAGNFGHSKVHQDFNNVFDVNGMKVELYFSPYEDPITRYLKALDSARKSIHFMIFAFTHDDIGRKFIEKKGQGIDVRGVMDRSQFTHSQYVEVYRLAASCTDVVTITNSVCENKVDIKRDGNENTKVPGDWQGGGGRLHHKSMIIDAGTDNAKVLTGSFNWSPNANNNNDENLMVIHSKEISLLYLAEWTKIYDQGLALPGDQTGYQSIVITEIMWAGSMREIDGKSYPYDGNEFIELYNPTDFEIDISYWSLVFPIIGTYDEDVDPVSGGTLDDSDDGPPADAIRKREIIGFPEGTVIPAKSYFIVAEPDLRNDNQNAYDNIDFSLYNELSNFMTFNDRRAGRDDWDDACAVAYSDYITSFPTSNGYNIQWDNGAGLLIELRDNRGSLIDIAGDAAVDTDGKCITGCENSLLQKGGFHNRDQVLQNGTSDATVLWNGINSSAPEYTCGDSTSSSYIMVSMERKANFGNGADYSNWDHATRAGSNVFSDFKTATYATPGEKNSNW